MVVKKTSPGTFCGTLTPHQFEGTSWLLETPRALLADDTGLGKTIEAIAFVGVLKDRGELRGDTCVLWLTEANLIEQTRREFETHAPSLAVLTSKDKLFVPQKRPKGQREYLARYFDGVDVVIVSYDRAHSMRGGLVRRFPQLCVVVLDEVMALKGRGQQHESARVITAQAERVVAMTATPHENDLMETHAVLELLHLPNLWGRNEFSKLFVEWAPAYRIPGTHYVVEAKPIGLKHHNMPYFHDFLAKIALRRTADEAALNLPVRVGETLRWVPLPIEQQRAYDALAKRKGGTAHTKKTQVGRSSGGCSGLIDAVMEELARRSDAKVIVYCETLAVVGMVAERLDAVGIGNRVIEGAVKSADRAKAMADFEHDPGVRVLVGSRVLELGLNLQHCRVLISLDCSDNPQREHQREGRIRRIGSPHTTYEHLTLMPDTPTARKKVANLDRKSADAHAVLQDSFAPSGGSR